MGKLSLPKFSAVHSLTQAGLSLPAGVHSVLQTTEQKTANPQMRKRVGFLPPNKALSMESFLHWFKPAAEIKKKNQGEKPAFGRNAFCLVGDACRGHTAVLETHCLPVFARHTSSPGCGLLLTLLRAETSAQTHTHTRQLSCALTFVQ